MANIIKPKRSNVASKVPTTSDIVSGEIAVNSADQKIYTNNGSSVVQIGSGNLSGLGDVNITSVSNNQILKYDSATSKWINGTGGGGGSGDVVGPASSTDNAIVRFDSTTGKLIQNSTVTINDDGTLDNVNAITFDLTPTNAPNTSGTMFWDSGDGTPSVVLNANTSLQLGQENVALVYNGTGSTITKGQVVAVSGAQGQRPSVVLADADSEPYSAATLGIAAENISNGAEGFICTFGLVRGLDTSAFTAGDPIWLSQTAGAFTATKPTAPAHLVFLGWVVKVNASSGEVFVHISNGWELDELHNVLITSPQSGNTLIYDATAGVWKNANLTDGAGITITEGAGTITIANAGVTSATASTGISVSASTGAITITNTAPDQTVALTAGTGISTSGTYPNFTITNTAPDQTVAISAGTGMSVSGTYPNFTVTNTDLGSSQSIFKNFAVAGQSDIVADNNNDTLTVAAGTGISLTTNATTDTLTITNSAPDQTVALSAGTGISVSGTYPNFTITNTSPSSGGTVTSVSGTGTVSGLTLSGTVTTSGSLTLGGSISFPVTSVAGKTGAVTLASSDVGLGSVTNISQPQYFNNTGQNHNTWSDFNSPTDFGYRYIQGNTNGPGIPSATQYYNWGIGLGNEYAYSSYVMQMAIPRTPLGGNPYLSVRYREAGTWGSWSKIYAGYADSAGTATSATSATTATTATTANGVAAGVVTGKMIYDNFTATASQTTFTTSNTYTSGKISVYANGIRMVNGSDVTVTSGTSVVFATGLAVGTNVNLVYPI